MALHGDIKMNGLRIGSWHAQRVKPVEVTPNTLCTYACQLHIKDQKSLAFTLLHRYGDGAAALAAAVIGYRV